MPASTAARATLREGTPSKKASVPAPYASRAMPSTRRGIQPLAVAHSLLAKATSIAQRSARWSNTPLSRSKAEKRSSSIGRCSTRFSWKHHFANSLNNQLAIAGLTGCVAGERNALEHNENSARRVGRCHSCRSPGAQHEPGLVARYGRRCGGWRDGSACQRWRWRHLRGAVEWPHQCARVPEHERPERNRSRFWPRPCRRPRQYECGYVGKRECPFWRQRSSHVDQCRRFSNGERTPVAARSSSPLWLARALKPGRYKQRPDTLACQAFCYPKRKFRYGGPVSCCWSADMRSVCCRCSYQYMHTT